MKQAPERPQRIFLRTERSRIKANLSVDEMESVDGMESRGQNHGECFREGSAAVSTSSGERQCKQCAERMLIVCFVWRSESSLWATTRRAVCVWRGSRVLKALPVSSRELNEAEELEFIYCFALSEFITLVWKAAATLKRNQTWQRRIGQKWDIMMINVGTVELR